MRFELLDRSPISGSYVSVYFINLIIIFHGGHTLDIHAVYLVFQGQALLLFSNITPYVKMLVMALVNETSLTYP